MLEIFIRLILAILSILFSIFLFCYEYKNKATRSLSLGANIKKQRLKLRLSRCALAKNIDSLAWPYYFLYIKCMENGIITNPSFRIVCLISDGLQLPVDDLF